MQNLEKRILLVGTCGSGSTALAKCFLQRQDTEVLSQVMKTAVERGSVPDHEAFYLTRSEKSFLFDKEVFGWRNKNLCRFSIFPADYRLLSGTHLIFLFRDPRQVWNAWIKREWATDIELFFLAYEHLHETYVVGKEILPAQVVIFDEMAKDAERVLQTVCRRAQINYDESMLRWSVLWGRRRGGLTGNPDIDRYSSFAQSRVRSDLTYPLETQNHITSRLENIWAEVTLHGNETE